MSNHFQSDRETLFTIGNQTREVLNEFGDFIEKIKIKPLDTTKTIDIDDVIQHKSSNNDLAKIELICNGLHKVAQKMRSRYDKRTPFIINDEYDVQDFFGSLLE